MPPISVINGVSVFTVGVGVGVGSGSGVTLGRQPTKRKEANATTIKTIISFFIIFSPFVFYNEFTYLISRN